MLPAPQPFPRLYSLRQSRSFAIARETTRWNESPPEPAIVSGLPYFVRDSTNARLRTDQALLWTVERGVQQDLKRFWTASCREEQSERRELEARAGPASGSVQRAYYARRLDAHASPGCDNLKRFFGLGGAGGGGARTDGAAGRNGADAGEFA